MSDKKVTSQVAPLIRYNHRDVDNESLPSTGDAKCPTAYLHSAIDHVTK